MANKGLMSACRRNPRQYENIIYYIHIDRHVQRTKKGFIMFSHFVNMDIYDNCRQEDYE